jgi:hypothetical protein
MALRLLISVLLCAQVCARDFFVLDVFEKPQANDNLVDLCDSSMTRVSIAMEVKLYSICINNINVMLNCATYCAGW